MSQHKKPWWWLGQTDSVARFTAYLACFTAALVAVAVLQWWTINGQLDEMRTEQKPFVYFDKPIFIVGTDDLTTGGKQNEYITDEKGSKLSTGYIVTVRLTLTNSGNTGTQFEVLVACPKSVALDDQKEPFVHFKWDEAAAVRELVGPKQTVEINGCDINGGDIDSITLGNVHQYILGEVRYDGPVARRTQIDREITVYSFDGAESKINAGTVPRGQHNCADDHCPKD
jgi:hypothetical protein